MDDTNAQAGSTADEILAKPKKKVVKKTAKKAKPKPAKKVVKKTAKKAKPKPAKKAVAPAVVRSHRVDVRLTKAEKMKLQAKAKATRRTVTSVMLELIEKMR